MNGAARRDRIAWLLIAISALAIALVALYEWPDSRSRRSKTQRHLVIDR